MQGFLKTRVSVVFQAFRTIVLFAKLANSSITVKTKCSHAALPDWMLTLIERQPSCCQTFVFIINRTLQIIQLMARISGKLS